MNYSSYGICPNCNHELLYKDLLNGLALTVNYSPRMVECSECHCLIDVYDMKVEKYPSEHCL